MVIERNLDEMLTVSEVADMLHVHTNTLRQWSNDGRIKTYRISTRGDRRYKREDIAAFLKVYNQKYGTLGNA